MNGSEITEREVKGAIKSMKNGKATGPDDIAIEMIRALDEFGILKITAIANEVYDKGEFPPELLKSIFIALPKSQVLSNVSTIVLSV